VLAITGAVGCAGEAPAERYVAPEGSPIAINLPNTYAVSTELFDGGTSLNIASERSNHPGGVMIHAPVGRATTETLALRDLRRVGPEGVDPLDEDVASGAGIEPIGYAEIDDDRWWGIRMQVLVEDPSAGELVLDRLVLVGREHADVVQIELRCAPDCYRAHQTEIDTLLASWTEDQP
jgi:hypothetical protein